MPLLVLLLAAFYPAQQDTEKMGDIYVSQGTTLVLPSDDFPVGIYVKNDTIISNASYYSTPQLLCERSNKTTKIHKAGKDHSLASSKQIVKEIATAPVPDIHYIPASGSASVFFMQNLRGIMAAGILLKPAYSVFSKQASVFLYNTNELSYPAIPDKVQNNNIFQAHRQLFAGVSQFSRPPTYRI